MSAPEEWPYRQVLEQVSEVFGWPGCLSPAETVEAAKVERALADTGRVADAAAVQPRVFRLGDLEPVDVPGVLDCDTDCWTYDRDGEQWIRLGDRRTWSELLEDYGPLVSCPAVPDYHAVVAADDQRRAVEQGAGDTPC